MLIAIPINIILLLGIVSLTQKNETDEPVAPPAMGALPDGLEVNIGLNQISSIVGISDCHNGLGETFLCTPFTIRTGAKQPVLLANGELELWTTEIATDGTVYLMRPNGTVVTAVRGGCAINSHESEDSVLASTTQPQGLSCPL